MSTPGFFVYRDTTVGEPIDPCAALQFFPAKDSDELFFALKVAYPIVKTHSERMRNAVIDFLIKERDDEQAKSQMPFPVDASAFESTSASPWSSFPSISSSSTLSSPDLIDLATPASFASPAMPAMGSMPSMPSMPSIPSMNRQLSQASNVASTPAIDQMTSVFSLSDHSQPKAHVRRKMTASEKAEYRKRRIVKACDKCSKRKRKCDHNQTEMETLASRQKVTKQRSPASSSNTSTSRIAESLSAPPPAPSELFSFNDDPLFGLAAPEGQDDLFNLIDFDMPSLHQENDWSWSESQDWTLLDDSYPPGHYPNRSADALYADRSATLYSSHTSQSPQTVLQHATFAELLSIPHSRDQQISGNTAIADGMPMALHSTLSRHETSSSDGGLSSKSDISADTASLSVTRPQRASDAFANAQRAPNPQPRPLLQGPVHNDGPSPTLRWVEADETVSESSSFGNGARRSVSRRTEAHSKTASAIASATASSGHGSRRPFFEPVIGSESSDSETYTLDPKLLNKRRPSRARHTAIEVEHRQSANAEPSKPLLDAKQTKSNSNGAGARKLLQQHLDDPRVLMVQGGTNQGLERAARASGGNAGLTGVYASGLPTSRFSSARDLSGRSESENGLYAGLLGVQSSPTDIRTFKTPSRSKHGLPSEERSPSRQKDGHVPRDAAGGMPSEPSPSLAPAVVYTHGRERSIISSTATLKTSRQEPGRVVMSLAATAPQQSLSPALSGSHAHDSPTLTAGLMIRVGSARAPHRTTTSPAQEAAHVSNATSSSFTAHGAAHDLSGSTTTSASAPVLISTKIRRAVPSSASPSRMPGDNASANTANTTNHVANANSKKSPQPQAHVSPVASATFPAPSTELTTAALLNEQIVGLIGAICGALAQCLMDNSAAPIRRKRVDGCRRGEDVGVVDAGVRVVECC